jgi:hypothetical protein
LILARTYAGKTLDIFEFGVIGFKSIESFNIQEVSRDMKPLLLFQGEQFEFSDKHMRLKNLLFGNYLNSLTYII